jgi:hypothetical protein
MSLPADIARCPGVDWDPFGVEPHCLDCARRTEGIRDYMAGARVVWMEAPLVMPCPERLEPKK